MPHRPTHVCIAFTGSILLLHIFGFFSTITSNNVNLENFTAEQLINELRLLDPKELLDIANILATKPNAQFPVLLALLTDSASVLSRSSKAELLSRQVDAPLWETAAANQKQSHRSQSKFNIWDIPRTEIYRDWTRPPGQYGSSLRAPAPNMPDGRLGVTENAKLEAKAVVEMAKKQLTISGIAAEYQVVRYDRRVERGHGVQYNVLFQSTRKIPSQWTAVHLSRPFQNLHVDTVDTTTRLMLYIVVAVENRTPRLIKLIKSLSKMSQYITLVVVDHSSTDNNVRRVVERGNYGLKHKRYLWAPRSIVRFSRALMLDYGIREVFKEDADAIFFTVDVDMEVPLTLPQMVFSSVRRSTAIYAPIVRTLDKDGESKYFDWGYGMLGAFAADYVYVGGYDVDKFRYGWGGEDIDLVTNFLRKDFFIVRPEEHHLVHRWHPTLAWRSKNGCRFSWRRGEICTSKHDEHKKRIIDREEEQKEIDGRVWSLSIKTGVHCGQTPTRHNAFDLEVPPGKYLVTMGSSTGGWSVAGQDIPPTVNIRVQLTENGKGDVKEVKVKEDLTLDDIGHAVVVEVKEITTLWMWHYPLVPSDLSACSDNRGETNVVVTELMPTLALKSLGDQILRIDGAHHCSPQKSTRTASSSLSASSGPLHLTSGAYTIIAESGGFDAGDGKIYFKADLRFIVLANSGNTKLLHATKLGQQLTLNVQEGYGGYLFGLVRDQDCSDNRGTLVLRVVRNDNDASKSVGNSDTSARRSDVQRTTNHHAKMIEV
jgi:hypothetical protein